MQLKKTLFILPLLLLTKSCFCWGFYAHKKINFYAVFLLPPEMIVFFKPNIDFISEHSVDPDKRRYAVKEEAPRHYIDIDNYGSFPYNDLPRRWSDAVAKYSEDSLQANGVVPWWVLVMQRRLTEAFQQKDGPRILKLAAEIGHYISDAHVPLHTSSNHDGQHTGQKGIHGFWESRIPELLAEKEWNFFIGKAEYIRNKEDFIWNRVLESAAAADTVLRVEKELSKNMAPDQRFSFEDRNGTTVRQYASGYARLYDRSLNGMVERRMRTAIYSVASFWFSAWIDAGQPDLKTLSRTAFTADELLEFETLNQAWRNNHAQGRAENN